MEGDDCLRLAGAVQGNFYPRPHMEGDDGLNLIFDGESISTHALTWRATSRWAGTYLVRNISTHALTWRATFAYKYGQLFHYISTHALTWRATGEAVAEAVADYFISTHALTWRATQPIVAVHLLATDFYPRPHMEGDFSVSICQQPIKPFLPTPSHGGRPCPGGRG